MDAMLIGGMKIVQNNYKVICEKWGGGEEEVWAWDLSLRRAIQQEEEIDTSFYWCFWSILVPSNVTTFAWRLVIDKIQMKDNLRKRNINIQEQDYTCPFYYSEEETSTYWFVYLYKRTWYLFYPILSKISLASKSRIMIWRNGVSPRIRMDGSKSENVPGIHRDPT
ncbi:hypothetical protein CR513_56993, partial [Mucuna pruriens]